jgi:5-methyltetrahydrofolate--homocysteine methyltransferase
MIDREKNRISIRVIEPKLDQVEKEKALKRLSQAVVMRDCRTVSRLTEHLVKDGMDLFEILNHGLIPGMLDASERFRRGVFFIPELLMSSRALKIGLNILRPMIREIKKDIFGKVVIGTVKFDLHDIGKNLVVILLEGNGFEIVDLGVDVSPEKFVNAVEKSEAKILAMSSLLTSTMSWMKFTIELLHASGIHRRVKTMVGGAPVTPIFAKNIGADAYCREATSAPSVAKKLLGIEENGRTAFIK